MRKLFLILVILISLIGCSTATPEPPPTNTPVPSPTSPPASPTSPPSYLLARNYLGSYEIEGVSVEVVRVLFGSAKAVSEYKGLTLAAWASLPRGGDTWRSADVIGEVILRYTNNRDAPVMLSFGSCGGSSLSIGGQQIFFHLNGMDAAPPLCDSPLDPQASMLQGVWFPMKEIPIDDITAATLVIECAKTVEGDECLGADWNFELDLSNLTWEDKPEELNG